MQSNNLSRINYIVIKRKLGVEISSLHSLVVWPATKSRPLGVTIIAILNIISGIVMLSAGLGLTTAQSFIPAASTIDPNLSGQLAVAGLLGSAGVVIGGILIVLAIISFVVAWGLLKAKSWAWLVTVILATVSIIMGIISLIGGNIGSIVNIVISGVIIYYLYRPHVKAYFGRTTIVT